MDRAPLRPGASARSPASKRPAAESPRRARPTEGKAGRAGGMPVGSIDPGSPGRDGFPGANRSQLVLLVAKEAPVDQGQRDDRHEQGERLGARVAHLEELKGGEINRV